MTEILNFLFMKNLIVLMVAVAAVCAMAGCGGNKVAAPEGVESYCHDDAVDEDDLREVFSDVELIPLEFTGEHYPQNFLSLEIADSVILVYDQSHTLTVFDQDGKYISSSAEKYGQGPEEFTIGLGYSWNPYSRLIEILGYTKIMFYDKEFNFVRSCKAPSEPGRLIIENICDLSPTRHVLLHNGIGNKPYRIFLFDSEKEEILDEKDYEEWTMGGGPSAQEKRFFRLADGEIYCMPIRVTDKILKLKPDSLTFENAVRFVPGKNSLSAKELDEMCSNSESFYKYRESGKEIPYLTMFNSENIFDYINSGPKIFSNLVYVINRKNGSLKRYREYEGKSPVFPEIADIDEEYAYSVIEKETLAESPKLLLDKAEKKDSILGAIEDESLIVLKYKIKE